MRVSVLLACWNAERYVGDAVRSVLAQAPDEVIAVDDGSTDGSAAVLAAFGPPVLLLRQENRGVAATLNRAAASASGDALAFIDADDLWLPGKLALQRTALAADPALDAVFGHMRHFVSPDLPAAEQAVLRTRQTDAPAPTPAYTKGGMLIRRTAFERLGRFDPARRHADFIDWYARATVRGFRWRLLPEVVYLRRLHAGNMGRRNRPQQRRDYLLAMKAMLDARRTQARQAQEREG